MRVSDLMTRNVVYVLSFDQLSTAAKLMWDFDCGCLPVVEGSSNRVIGMITDRDICMACWSQDRPPSSLQVSAASSHDLYFCSPEDSISSAESLMRSKQIRRIPVLDSDRRLVGILSLADIAREEERERARKLAGEVSSDEVAATLGTICQPVQQQTIQPHS